MDTGQWVEKIVQVQSGLLTATEAANQLGVSRKTYYKRENRALAGLVASLQDRESGRPGKAVDEEKERLLRMVLELQQEKQILEQRLRIREVLDEHAGGEKKGTPHGGGG